MVKISRILLCAFLSVCVHTTHSFAQGSTLLSPVAGYRTGSGGAWVVVKSAKPPEIALDGNKIDFSGLEVDGVYHQRVANVRESGSILVVDGVTVNISSIPGSPLETDVMFHGTGDGGCKECHDVEGPSCNDCHTSYGGGKHSKDKFGQRCRDCHAEGIPTAEKLAGLCRECHKKHSLKKHPKLRHPVEAEHDPKRPGRKMDCASCHYPHDPSSRKKMGTIEKQEWCRSCHSTP